MLPRQAPFLVLTTAAKSANRKWAALPTMTAPPGLAAGELGLRWTKPAPNPSTLPEPTHPLTQEFQRRKVSAQSAHRRKQPAILRIQTRPVSTPRREIEFQDGRAKLQAALIPRR